MAAGKPVKIAILTDSRDAVRGFDKAGDAAKDTGARFDSVAESSDRVASKGAQAAGALSGLGDLVGGKFGAAMQTGGIATQALADSGDLLNVITESAIVRKIKDTAVTAAQTTATVAKAVADKAAAGAARLWAAGQWAVNAAMSANPIGLVVVAIVALVAAIVIAYKKSATFRAIVTGAFGAVKSVAVGAFSWIRSNWPLLLAILTGPFGLAVLAITKNRDRIVALIEGIKDKVTGVFAKAGTWLLSAGKAIIQGLIDGIGDMVKHLKDKLGSVTDLIPDWKGPMDKDRRLLTPAGKAIMGGLISGIEGSLPNLRRTLGDVTAAVAGVQPSLTGSLSLDSRAAFATAQAGGTAAVAPIQVNVSGALDPDAVARQIVRLLVDLARRLGVPVAALLGGAR